MKFKYGDYAQVVGDEFFKYAVGRVINYNVIPVNPPKYVYSIKFADDMVKAFQEDQLEPQAKPWSVPNTIQVPSPGGSIFGGGGTSIDANITTNGPLVDGPNFKITYT